MNNQSRRDFLLKSGYGLGGLALSGLLPGGGLMQAAFASELEDPLAPKATHFPAKVKSVIWLHMDGAPSTIDLYDYKPELVKLAGQEVPPSFLKGIKTSTQGGVGKLFASNRTWKQYGESGAWFSDLLPNLSQHADIKCYSGCNSRYFNLKIEYGWFKSGPSFFGCLDTICIRYS